MENRDGNPWVRSFDRQEEAVRCFSCFVRTGDVTDVVVLGMYVKQTSPWANFIPKKRHTCDERHGPLFRGNPTALFLSGLRQLIWFRLSHWKLLSRTGYTTPRRNNLLRRFFFIKTRTNIILQKKVFYLLEMWWTVTLHWKRNYFLYIYFKNIFSYLHFSITEH